MNTFVASPGFDASRFKGTTLILPSVSIGNVPQLATDLLLAALKLDRVGSIEDENVVPVLGPADSAHEPSSTAKGSHSSGSLLSSSSTTTSSSSSSRLSLAVEVFQSKDGKWTLVQQRSPTVAHRSGHYVENLVQFIRDSQFDQVVLLASADGARRTDSQLRSGHPVRYIGSPRLSTELLQLVEHQLQIQPMERIPVTEEERIKEQQQQQSTSVLAERVQDIHLEKSGSTTVGGTSSASVPTTTSTQRVLERVPRIPSGGIARRLHGLCQQNDIGILTLVAFAMEGDNAEDAIFLANVLNAVLKVYTPTEEQVLRGEGGWKVPKSWDSLYGNTFPQDMYQ
ncbi:Proteasome assembly chaperone 2 [Podila epigama]|nr:Proteasome assembly chaperone 2 [Podila epigama]